MVKNKVFTSKGQEILIDAEDFQLVSKFTWYVDSDGYAHSRLPRNLHPQGKQKQIKMHRLVLEVTDSKVQIDHINLNKLDNRKQNLRLCNSSQNQANIKPHKRNKLSKKGIRFRYGKYEAYVWKDKSIYLGRFNSLEEASKAYDEAARKFFGEYARINQCE